MIQLKNTLESYSDPVCYVLLENQPYTNPEATLLEELKAKDLFESKSNTLYHATRTSEKGLQEIFFLGCGTEEEVTLESIRVGIAKVCKKAQQLKIKKIAFHLNPYFMKDKWIQAIGEGVILSTYDFDKYLSDKKTKSLEAVEVIIPGAPSFTEALEEGMFLGEMTKIARDLSNEPGDICTPNYLAEKAQTLGDKTGFETHIYGKKEIESLKMDAFLAVARGSSFEPKLIVMEYKGAPEGKTLGLVGKGITFDTGGLSIKPANSMLTMQGDMGGAASVIAALGAIAYQKLPINVTAVVAACDNAVSSKSYRPNDIITSRSGKTIFITNTDAEGRLTLIDAMDYILTEKKVDYVVDIATLTGAAEIALGQKIAATLTNNDTFHRQLKKASKASGERIWELPHDEDFLELIKSPYADLNNSGGRYGGTITAGLFVGSVVKDTPWIHIDIAGPSWSENNEGYFSKGATGFGTRLLYQLAKELNDE